MLKEKAVKLAGRIFAVFLFCLTFQLLHAAPIPLSDAELDQISAGYVDLAVNARATAEGPNAVARFSANVEQTIGEAQPDNYIYTTTTGLATAFAKGRRVSTEVGYFFQTDEEILSFDVIHKRSSRTVSGKHKNKNAKKKHKNRKKKSAKKKKANKNKRKGNKNKKRAGRKKNTREKQLLYVSVVTRRPAD